MSYSREDEERIQALKVELDALETERARIECLPGEMYVTTNPAWTTATLAVIAAEKSLEQAKNDAKQEMRTKAEFARKYPDSTEASAFYETYSTDPRYVKPPKDDNCVVM